MAVDTASAQELSDTPARTAVGVWLLICAALVFAVAVLGGVTRLEHAGLSITSWKPLAGILPPLNAVEWEAEFSHYRQFHEYLLVHQGMELAGFKYIFWFEYTHRLLARLIGVVFLVPLLFFLLSRAVDRRYAAKLGVLLVLGGLQGALGWYMVSSGLTDRPDVSHYRLTAHLGLAVVLYGAILWFALEVLLPPDEEDWGVRVSPGFRYAAYGAAALVFLLILSGGFVAGLDAGFDYNTFPKMNGAWIPPGLFPPQPLDHGMTVQFVHRWFGVLVAAYVVLLWGLSLDVRLPDGTRSAFRWLLIMVMVQGALGLTTLLLVVPVAIAALHQAFALLLLGVTLVAAYSARHARVRPPPGIHVLPSSGI